MRFFNILTLSTHDCEYSLKSGPVTVEFDYAQLSDQKIRYGVMIPLDRKITAALTPKKEEQDGKEIK